MVKGVDLLLKGAVQRKKRIYNLGEGGILRKKMT